MFFYHKDMAGTLFKEDKLLNYNGHDIIFYSTQGKVSDMLIKEADTVTKIISDQEKIFLRLRIQFFHAILDTLAIILIEHKRNPNALFVINIERNDYDMDTTSYFRYIKTVMERNKINYQLVRVSTRTPLIINNFYFFKMYPLNVIAVNNVVEESLKDSANVIPNKKVYLSRKKIEFPKDDHMLFQNVEKNNFSALDDERLDDEEAVCEYFKNLGFEIVCPEDFDNFEDQIYFFSQVKTLASVTTAGLMNAIFMPDGGKVIELTVPLILHGCESLHNVYHGISFVKKHKYMSVPNTRKAQEIIDIIDGDEHLKEFINE